MSERTNKPLWALGLMSGTSADGIDAALLLTDGVRVLEFGETLSCPYPKDLKAQILEAYGRPAGPEHYPLTKAITEAHAEAVQALMDKAGVKPSLIGFHGQTIYHRPPQKPGEIGETHQLSDGELLARLTGIDVVEQFRLKDMANGGQGAPLVPVYHQALAASLPKPLAIINIGGVANVTWIGENSEDLIAFDTGPGNGLIDDWVRKHTDLPWDEGGKIAVRGHVDDALLERWLSHPYFKASPPKSLDRHTFKTCLNDVEGLEDGAATLTAFTVAALKRATQYFPHKPSVVLVAGGGAHNPALMGMLQKELETEVKAMQGHGFDGDALEAQAFAFLAVRSLYDLPLTFPGTTGAPHPTSGGILRSI